MLTFNKKIDSSLVYPIDEPYSKNEIIFFDIETTGFSAKTSYVYLIGCMYYENNSWHLIQWLLEDPKQELDLLIALSSKLKSYKRIIHYNGSGFDIPFLTKKYLKYNIEQPFSHLDSFDLYKKILPYRRLLPFPNLKLQTLQEHLGYKRTDKNSGGDLIDIYSKYLGRLKYENLVYPNKLPYYQDYLNNKDSSIDNAISPLSEEILESTNSNELANILLLHNYDDLAGFLDIFSILTYVDFLNDGISDSNVVNINVKTNQGQLYIEIETNNNYPYEKKLTTSFNGNKQIQYNNTTNATCNANEKYSISLKNNKIYVKSPILNGKLKYFFENYREYYYLPREDMAIHKSVAKYVDKEYRIKAKPSNCYTYLEGVFIPVFNLDLLEKKNIKKFKYDYNSAISFLEIDNIINSKENIILWINSLLDYAKTNKNSVILWIIF